MGIEAVLFYAFGVAAVIAAFAMVLFVRNVVAGAMSLVVTMISLAGIYVLLEAHLVAAIQIMVYAGAIVVLFLFVIMLLNLRGEDFGPVHPVQTAYKTVVSLAAVLILIAVWRRVSAVLPEPGAAPPGFGGFRELGVQLFTLYVVPVEIAGFLLLAGIVGAVVLAKRRID